MKEDLEEAIVNCNVVLSKWVEFKPKLMTYETIRGLIIHAIKKAVNRSLTWRDARQFLATRILIIDTDYKEGCINRLFIQEGERSLKTPKAIMVIGIVNSLNYEELAIRARDKRQDYYNEVSDLSFKNIESINF